MSRWYRAYEGTVTDAKLGEAALVAEVSRSVAIAAWHCLLESAAGRNNCGSFDATPRRIAVILCEPPSRIEALFAAYEELGLIVDGAVASWKRRQFQSDGSTERVKRYRENRKAQGLQAQWQPSSELRQSIYNRDGRVCVYCGAGDDLTIDHKTPEMHGGDNSPENLQTACRSCNAQKRDLTHNEYVARLSGNGDVTLQKRRHIHRTETEETEPKGSLARAWVLPVGVSLQVWTDLLTNRKRKRLPNTDTAWKKFQADLASVSALTGIPPPQLIEQCTAKGWGAIYNPREDRSGQQRTDSMGRHQPSDGLSPTTRAARDVFGIGASH